MCEGSAEISNPGTLLFTGCARLEIELEEKLTVEIDGKNENTEAHNIYEVIERRRHQI